MKKVYREYRVAGIFLLVVIVALFAALLFSCGNSRIFSDDSGELPILPPAPVISLSYTLLYKYDGYWSMRHDEYFKLDDRNKYEKKILYIKIIKGMNELYERLKRKLEIRIKELYYRMKNKEDTRGTDTMYVNL